MTQIIMNYDNGFILQKAVDWALLRMNFARMLLSGCKNYHWIIHENNSRLNRMSQRSTAKGKVKFQFELANGEVLRLKLYEHLKV